MDAPTFRPATPADRDTLLRFATAEPVSWIGPERLLAERETNNYRDPWSWLAERAGRPVARALWWGPADAGSPAALDCVIVAEDEPDPAAVASGLIRAGLEALGTMPDFNVDLAPGWRSDPGAVRAAAWRERAAHGAGLTRNTERVSFAWTPSSPLPASRGTLEFRDGDDAEFRALFGAVADGSLDAHTIDVMAKHGREALADGDLDFYRSLPGRREAWKVAELPGAGPVGFVIPTRNAYDASISYLGILPEQRGNGLVHELLAEMVRVHVTDGAERVVGTTDAANGPMRAAFERAHFEVTRTRIVHAA